MDDQRNPFDQFDNEPEDSSGAVLRPAPAPSLWESFKANIASVTGFNQASDSPGNAPRQLADAKLVERVEKRTGVAQPGDSPFAGKPSQQEYDDARFRLSQAKRQKEYDDAFTSPTIAGKAVGLAGGLLGGIASPENVISAGGVLAKGGATVLGRLGMGGTGARVAGVGLEAGAINAALDIPTQAARVAAGIEDQYDPMRTALAFGAGQVLGSGMAGVAHLVQTRRMTAAQEAQAVDDYLRTRNAELAGGGRLTQEVGGNNLPREALDIPPVVPGADAGKIQPDALARISEAAKVASPDESGMVRMDLSPQDREALRTAGYPVSDDNLVPQSVIADLARREAVGPVEVTARGDQPATADTPATARQNARKPFDEALAEAELDLDFPKGSPDYQGLSNLYVKYGYDIVRAEAEYNRLMVDRPTWDPLAYDVLEEADTAKLRADFERRFAEWQRRYLAETASPTVTRNETTPLPDRMAAPETGAGETVTIGGGVRPAGDAGQPGQGAVTTPAGQPLQMDRRIGTVEPAARFGQQQELGPQRLSAPQAISVEPIRRDLGLDIPGTLIESPDNIKAFHGTPYDFDKFDLSKIGTGEGAQAYGHGLYFAENEKIARSYSKSIDGERVTIDGRRLSQIEEDAASVFRTNNFDYDAAIKQVISKPGRSATERVLQEWKKNGTRPTYPIGNVYEVSIKANPNLFLDWDKPLGEQSPFVQEAVRKALGERPGPLETGNRQYARIAANFQRQGGMDRLATDTAATKALAAEGIAGIRYRDITSRTEPRSAELRDESFRLERRINNLGKMEAPDPDWQKEIQQQISDLKKKKEAIDRQLQETRNYVVFDDNLIQIVSKNGVPLKKPIPIVEFLRGEATARQFPMMTAPAVLKAREIVQAALDMLGEVKPFTGKVAKPSVKGAPVGVFMFDANNLRTDAQRFQYKDNGDTEGVTTALKAVSRWDAAKANQLIVWQDKANRLFVVDGHQRSGLARRLLASGNEQAISIPGILYREVDGISPEYIRAIAAAKNIAEGSGSPIDGAKVLRSHPELLDGSMPITRTESRQAFDLAKLNDEAFRMVINEVVPYQQAAIVGRMIPNDGDRQVAALKAIARFEPRNETEAATLVQRVSQSELAKSEGETGSLFGDMMGAESTAGEEMRIVARAVQELKKDKNLLSRVVANADRIEQAGSQIDRGSARSVADDAELFAKVITSNAYSAGPVRTELVRLAKEVQSGAKTVNDASREILAAVRGEAERSLRAGAGDSGNARGEFATEAGAEGKPQTLVPGVEPVTDRQRLDLEASRPLQGGNKAPPAGGLFDEDARAQGDLLDPQPLRAQAKRDPGPPVNPNADARFPQRQQLPGEGQPTALPANATPEEIASFRITTEHRQIAELLGKKLEVDGRFQLKNVLGEYKPKEGVLRIREDGDTSVFNHELGHAIDQRLRYSSATRPDMIAAIARNDTELRALDTNGTSDPAEGVAEFIRMYLDQPAFARKQAPNFADEFDMIVAKDPELKAVMERAYRATQIDSGMDPAQRMASMIAPAEEATGLRRFNDERKRYGIPATLSLTFDRFYANVIGKDRYVQRFTRLLNDAHFEKTGKPLPRQFQDDAYKQFRMLPGAKQAAIIGIYNGVSDYGRTIDGPKSASLRDAISLATDGALYRMDKPDDPVIKDFNAYLVARRSRNLYDRWEAGDLRNPPVRASKNEVLQSIQAFEKSYPQFVEAADKVFSYANAMWKKKFDAGLISKEIYETVAAKGGEYVPFFRDMQDDVARGGGGAGGAGQAQSVVKTIKGSSRDILDPLRSLMYDAAQTERVIAINDTFKTLVKLAESGGEFSGRFVERIPNTELKAVSIDMAEAMKNAARQAGLDPASADGIIRSMESLVGDDLSATVFRSSEITASGERIFFIWENGERAAYKVGNDPWSKNFFETVSSMNAVERDIMLAMFGKANAMFSQFITNAPQFALKNLIMDNASRIFVPRDTGVLGRVPGAAIATGIYTQLFDREFAKSYSALGGIRGGVASAAQRDLQNQQAGKVIAISPRTMKEWTLEATALLSDPKRFVVEVAKTPYHALQMVVKAIESTETMGRLGQAKIVNNHLKKQGASDVDAAFGAAFEARDILDYDRRGFATVGATRFFPFLNVGIQGITHANEVLVGNVFRAALQRYQRGGWDKLDGNDKAALVDAVKAWGTIAAAATMTYSYAMYMSDEPAYQAQSEYMRRRYYIFPAGQDETGRQKIATIPKPFDMPGAIMSAVEGFTYGLRRQDGKAWERLAKAMEDAALPRQVTGLQEFLGSNPFVKTGFEAQTGVKLGFEGGPSFPIVPQTLRSLPPDQQYNATTSWFAKMLGEKMGWSPMVVDHVMNGIGGTSIRDANYSLTAMFGDNPNITKKDAMNRVFFGALYRDAPGGGQFRQDLMKLMATDNGKYAQLARGYQYSREIGDTDNADKIYQNANETAKALMLLRGNERFRPADRQLHPLERTYAIGQIIGKIATDMSNQELEILNGARRRTRKGNERNIIEIDPTTSRAVSNTLQSLMAEETRNGLRVAGEPGYESYDLIDTKARYEAIRKLSPEVADEIQARIRAANILPIEHVNRRWPETKRRLLQDGGSARLTDLRASP